MTDKSKKLAHDIIDFEAQQIRQEYKTSTKGLVVKPNPINPATETIQVLEEALEAAIAYEK